MPEARARVCVRVSVSMRARTRLCAGYTRGRVTPEVHIRGRRVQSRRDAYTEFTRKERPRCFLDLLKHSVRSAAMAAAHLISRLSTALLRATECRFQRGRADMPMRSGVARPGARSAQGLSVGMAFAEVEAKHSEHPHFRAVPEATSAQRRNAPHRGRGGVLPAFFCAASSEGLRPTAATRPHCVRRRSARTCSTPS